MVLFGFAHKVMEVFRFFGVGSGGGIWLYFWWIGALFPGLRFWRLPLPR
ncbi:hypothetical protein A2U01_0106569, partial [Trifolium medium]|nr:hypothetical protein [Trifolium medium]